MTISTINIIGAGLAGSEAAWQIANRGIKVNLYDMKPHKHSPAHTSNNFAELVCSNSFRSDDMLHNAVGLLHEEMRRCGSLIMHVADKTKIPAGGALAVDREAFAQTITNILNEHPNITFISQEITSLPSEEFGPTIIATGPLTSQALAEDIIKKTSTDSLHFYDAIAPVVYTDSVDFSNAWYQSRYDKGDSKDYINCPLTEEEFNIFREALIQAPTKEFHEFEKPQYFEGCLPIEVLAKRGEKTLLFGPMKPVGLTNPHTGQRPYAVVQLRQDNFQDSLRNLVGFQTKMTYGAQKEVFSLIPALKNANFARLGGIHRNTFIQSPVLLDNFLRLKSMPHIRFAGQISGCEGYVESAAMGLLCGYFAALNNQAELPPQGTAFASLLSHVTQHKNIEDFQPMNINFGLFPADENISKKIKGADKKEIMAKNALQSIDLWAKNFSEITTKL